MRYSTIVRQLIAAVRSTPCRGNGAPTSLACSTSGFAFAAAYAADGSLQLQHDGAESGRASTRR